MQTKNKPALKILAKPFLNDKSEILLEDKKGIPDIYQNGETWESTAEQKQFCALVCDVLFHKSLLILIVLTTERNTI